MTYEKYWFSQTPIFPCKDRKYSERIAISMSSMSIAGKYELIVKYRKYQFVNSYIKEIISVFV